MAAVPWRGMRGVCLAPQLWLTAKRLESVRHAAQALTACGAAQVEFDMYGTPWCAPGAFNSIHATTIRTTSRMHGLCTDARPCSAGGRFSLVRYQGVGTQGPRRARQWQSSPGCFPESQSATVILPLPLHLHDLQQPPVGDRRGPSLGLAQAGVEVKTLNLCVCR